MFITLFIQRYICLHVFGFLKGLVPAGGTFALYSLLCRRAKLGLSSAPHATADEYSPYNSETPLRETRGSLLIKEFFDKHHNSRLLLLLVVLLGTSMVIGDGILTPSMSGIISFLHYIYFPCEVID